MGRICAPSDTIQDMWFRRTGIATHCAIANMVAGLLLPNSRCQPATCSLHTATKGVIGEAERDSQSVWYT